MELGNSSVRLVNPAAASAPESPKHNSYGLKSASLSPSETLAQSIAVIAPSGAPVMTIPLVFALTGAGSAMAYFIATVTILLVGLNINQFARTSASPGSLYTYITDHMHPAFGVLAGWALLIAYIGTASSVTAGVVNYTNVVLKDSFAFQANPVLLTALLTFTAGWLAYRDVQISARLMLWLQVASVALSLLVSAGILIQYGWRLDLAQFTLRGVTPEQLRLGLVLAIFSSVGFESATSLGAEARNPLTSIPRAVKWSAILAGMFFVLCAYSMVLGFQGEPIALNQSQAPLHVLTHKAGLPYIVGTLTDFGAVVTFFLCFLGCITAGARVLFLMGRHGALHSHFGEAHESNQTPHRAVLLASIAAFVPAGILAGRGMNPFELYGLLGTLATFGFLTAYILVSAAAPLYLRSLGRLTPRAIIGSILAVIAMGAALLGNLYPEPPAPYSALPYIYAGLLWGGFAWSMIRTNGSPSPAVALPGKLDALPNETD